MSHIKGVVYLGISPLPERHHFLHIERQNPLGVVPLRKVSHLAIKRTLNAVGVCADPIPNPSSPLSGLESTFYRSVFGGFRLKSNKLISGTHAVA